MNKQHESDKTIQIEKTAKQYKQQSSLFFFQLLIDRQQKNSAEHTPMATEYNVYFSSALK